MGLKRVDDLATLHIDELDVTIAASNSNLLACLVELATVGDRITGVKVDDLLHHPDVPDLDDTVRVTGADVLATDGECTVIYSVEMTEESLNGQTRAHVPDGDGAIGATTDEEVGEGLEVQTVNAISVLTVLLANLKRVQIEKLN